MVSCQKGPTRHAYAWQIGPFLQDTLDMWWPDYGIMMVADVLVTYKHQVMNNHHVDFSITIVSCASYNKTFILYESKLENYVPEKLVGWQLLIRFSFVVVFSLC